MTIVTKTVGNHESYVVRFMRGGKFLYFGYYRSYQAACRANETAKKELQTKPEYIATAKAVRMQNVRRVQWHLVNNQTPLVFCGFDFLTKTSISQYY
jgi:hypothetical protein